MFNSSTLIKATIAAFIVSFAGDFLWHDVILKDFYTSRLLAINGTQAASGFPTSLFIIEFIAALGTAYFVLKTSRTYKEAIGNGGFLGLLMVGPLNFVNHTLLLKWDMTIAMVDTLWGIVLGAIGGAVVAWVAHLKNN